MPKNQYKKTEEKLGDLPAFVYPTAPRTTMTPEQITTSTKPFWDKMAQLKEQYDSALNQPAPVPGAMEEPF